MDCGGLEVEVGLVATRRQLGFFQKVKEEDSGLLSLSLWFSQLAKVEKEEEGAGFIRRLLGVERERWIQIHRCRGTGAEGRLTGEATCE